jgi:hypothetical protein
MTTMDRPEDKLEDPAIILRQQRIERAVDVAANWGYADGVKRYMVLRTEIGGEADACEFHDTFEEGLAAMESAIPEGWNCSLYDLDCDNYNDPYIPQIEIVRTNRLSDLRRWGEVSQRYLEHGSSNPDGDPVSICVRVDGSTPAEAVERAKALLREKPTCVANVEQVDDDLVRVVLVANEKTGEYINLYVNLGNLTVEHDVPGEAE